MVLSQIYPALILTTLRSILMLAFRLLFDLPSSYSPIGRAVMAYLKYYPSIHLDGFTKSTRNLS